MSKRKKTHDDFDHQVEAAMEEITRIHQEHKNEEDSEDALQEKFQKDAIKILASSNHFSLVIADNPEGGVSVLSQGGDLEVAMGIRYLFCIDRSVLDKKLARHRSRS